MRKCPTLAVLFIAVLPPGTAWTDSQTVPSVRVDAGVANDLALPKEFVAPQWQTDLRPVLGSAPLGQVAGQSLETKGKPLSALLFLDDDTIVVIFVTREGEPALTRRNGLDADLPMRLRGLFLDAGSGRVKANISWPTDSRHSLIVSSHDEKFITERGPVLTLYSPDAKELKKLRLPPSPSGDTEWMVHSSQTGQTLLLVPSGLHQTPVPWKWVQTDDLHISRSWEDVQSGWVGISDGKIAMTACTWVYNCEGRIQIKQIDSDWKSIATLGRRNRPLLQFVDENTLFALSSSSKLMRTDGEVVIEDNKYEGCWWAKAIISANGRRLVVPSCKLTGAVRSLDLGGEDVLKKILVYDQPFRGLSHAIDFKGPRISGLAQLALSSNGKRLAILNEESLRVAELPPLPELPTAPRN